jgi:regulatory protein
VNRPAGEDIRESTAQLRSAIEDILSRTAAPTQGAPSRSDHDESARVDITPAETTAADIPDPSRERSTTASAYDAALRLLGVRARSQAEIRKRLLDKDFAPPEVDSVVARLGAAGLLDDADFAEQWVLSRHRHSGKGRTALRHELRHKGVADTLIEQALDQVDDDAERERAAELLHRKTARLSAADVADRDQRDKHTRRLVAMLARRGYSPSLAMNLVTAELNRLAAD